MATKKQIIEQILRSYHNGMPFKDSSLTEAEVNMYINQAIGFLALKNYTDAIKIDGVENIGDAFYSTFTLPAIAKNNDTGLYFALLPQVPASLSRGYGISSLLFPVSTGLAKAPIAVSPREVDFMDLLPLPPSKIFYWAEGNMLWMKSYINLVGKTPKVRMISTANNDLTAELTLPAEYENYKAAEDLVKWLLSNKK